MKLGRVQQIQHHLIHHISIIFVHIDQVSRVNIVRCPSPSHIIGMSNAKYMSAIPQIPSFLLLLLLLLLHNIPLTPTPPHLSCQMHNLYAEHLVLPKYHSEVIPPPTTQTHMVITNLDLHWLQP